MAKPHDDAFISHAFRLPTKDKPMAYSLVRSVLKPKGKNSKYEDSINIGGMLVKNIMTNYVDGWIVLTNPLLPGTHYLELNTFKSMSKVVNANLTFNNWLGSIGSIALPTLSTEPELETKKILYADATKARYVLQRVHPITPPPNNYPLGDLKDLLITKVGVLHSLLFANAIFSVNGLFHIADLTGYGVKIKDGGISADIAKTNNVGIISFRDIGEIEYVPVESAMITKPNPLIASKQTIWLNTGVDMTNKTPLLVLGGYLHVVDEIYDVINPQLGIIKVNFDKVNLLHRYFESRKIIDLSSLELSEASYNEEVVALPELLSDDVIAKYIDLSQTFIVLVDTPHLHTETYLLSKTGLPGVYVSPELPKYPLRTTFGLYPEYWYRHEYDQWAIDITSSYTPNYLFETTQWQDLVGVDTVQEASNPFREATANLIEIATMRRV